MNRLPGMLSAMRNYYETTLINREFYSIITISLYQTLLLNFNCQHQSGKLKINFIN